MKSLNNNIRAHRIIKKLRDDKHKILLKHSEQLELLNNYIDILQKEFDKEREFLLNKNNHHK